MDTKTHAWCPSVPRRQVLEQRLLWAVSTEDAVQSPCLVGGDGAFAAAERLQSEGAILL